MSGAWKVIEPRIPSTDATTSHTAALTKSTNSGTRHDAEISVAETGCAVVEVAFIEAADYSNALGLGGGGGGT